MGTRRVQNCNPAVELDAAGLALEDTLGQSARRLDLARFRQRRRAYIEAAGAVPATTPMWTGRAGWLADAQLWALVDGDAVLRGRMRPHVFLTLCEAASRYADSATGRNMAATAATLARDAGYSERTVSTWRALLAESGLGVLARQGSGGGGRPNRVPVWHLVSRAAVTHPRTCDLPSLRSSRGLSHLENISPSAHARSKRSATTRPESSPPRRRRAPQRPPRPLALQRLAAAFVARSYGLDRGHIGEICDAIRCAGIDPTAVTAAQIRSALDQDMRETGWSWPDWIERPGAFLRYRLSRVSGRLDALTQAPPVGGCAADGSLEGEAGQRPADPAVRAAAMAAIRAVLQSRTTARTDAMVSEDGCEMCGTAVEWRPSERHGPLCAACSAVIGGEATAPEVVPGVPVIA